MSSGFPTMIPIRQTLSAPALEDLPAAVDRAMARLRQNARLRPGSQIAVTAGSRGIAGIDVILKRVVAALRTAGTAPFLVPAMGSHGGGTAEGQVAMLESLGITEARVGAPIRASMEVVQVGRSEFGFPVWVDRHAAEADGIFVVNRIKPHTDFDGSVESGLMKMLAIGLGKHTGCLDVHRQTVQYGYRRVIPAIGKLMLERLPVIGGLGIVENCYDRTAIIEAFPAAELVDGETALLTRAKALMGRLPFQQLDILIVDEMGKNISGTGMDTNVIGRIMFVGEPEPETPRITRIVVLGLTPASHGNAIGIGMADFTTRQVVEGLDLFAIQTNAIAAMTPEKGRIPIALPTDREAVNAALTTIGAIAPEAARVAHIRNTLDLASMSVSVALRAEAAAHPHIEICGDAAPLAFDDTGRLKPLATD
ncbi:MAG: lactate racemase domain-containing protein [Desulfosarcinaceae bacterium]|nr:lactate racemase domain-containing protein [Desulfosarcinaceae bacterium]